MFLIEDDWHAEQQDGEFASLQDAVSELKRRADIPWDRQPNKAPCTSWRSCGRKYVVIEYDVAWSPWRQLSRTDVLEISADGVIWLHYDP